MSINRDIGGYTPKFNILQNPKIMVSRRNLLFEGTSIFQGYISGVQLTHEFLKSASHFIQKKVQ